VFFSALGPCFPHRPLVFRTAPKVFLHTTLFQPLLPPHMAVFRTALTRTGQYFYTPCFFRTDPFFSAQTSCFSHRPLFSAQTSCFSHRPQGFFTHDPFLTTTSSPHGCFSHSTYAHRPIFLHTLFFPHRSLFFRTGLLFFAQLPRFFYTGIVGALRGSERCLVVGFRRTCWLSSPVGTGSLQMDSIAPPGHFDSPQDHFDSHSTTRHLRFPTGHLRFPQHHRATSIPHKTTSIPHNTTSIPHKTTSIPHSTTRPLRFPTRPLQIPCRCPIVLLSASSP